MSAWSWTNTAHRCADCGTAAGRECTDQCPSAIEYELEDATQHDAALAAETRTGAAA